MYDLYITTEPNTVLLGYNVRKGTEYFMSSVLLTEECNVITKGAGSFPGVKRPGRGVDHTPPSIAEVTERVVLYLCSTSGAWPVLG